VNNNDNNYNPEGRKNKLSSKQNPAIIFFKVGDESDSDFAELSKKSQKTSLSPGRENSDYSSRNPTIQRFFLHESLVN